MIWPSIAALLASIATANAALAAPGCKVPTDLGRPAVEYPPADQPPRRVPIEGYTLALIWAPQHCFRAAPGAGTLRCGPATGRRFLLHGLWPDGAAGQWPQWCSIAWPLPRRVIARHYCATPSAQLLQHEWAKHGTCIPGATPGRYFAEAQRLFDHIRSPDMAALARARLDERSFADAFARANPSMSAGQIRLNLDPDGWLQEVWICLDRRRRYVACAARPQDDRTVRIR